ncbi:hypothetical protein ACP4OV_013744 [Aristida adscensionis]
MISWHDIYKVAAAMVPLYVPLLLGFWSVRWWKIFTPEQCESVNRLVAFFAIPFFTFGFTIHTDPFQANYRAIAADVVSKIVIAGAIGVWVLASRCHNRNTAGAAVNWSITSFSLSTLTSSLVVGVPMAQAMYGDWAQQLVIQLSVFQAIVWLTLLIFALEVRKAAIGTPVFPADGSSHHASGSSNRTVVNYDVEASTVVSDADIADDDPCSPPQSPEATNAAIEIEGVMPVAGSRLSLWALVNVVSYKLLRNPNTCASLGGIVLACITNRSKISLPVIVENSIAIMAVRGNGLSMFSMGLFMAQQDKLIPCGPTLTFLGLMLKFVLDPIAMTIGSLAVGLRGDVVRVAIIQAAVPQSITSFIFAKEYGLHPDVLSSAVIVGMIVSVPLIILFYVALEDLW